MSTSSESAVGIDPRESGHATGEPAPYNEVSFHQIGVLEAWRRYPQLGWGKGQCLAILDDGCDLTDPRWQAPLPWGPKVIATYNSLTGTPDPTPVPPGYHGTSVGFPSSLNHGGVRGLAFNNHVAHVRCVTVVHLHGRDEAPTMAAALRWVLDNRERYRITAVNLSPLDDERHREPVPTAVDEPLRELRKQGVWVSGPCGNHHYTDGISWPACQPHCFAIGAAVPGRHAVHLDRFTNTDLLVAAQATSSSNAYAAASAMVLREALESSSFPWHTLGSTLPDAILALFQKTGVPVDDPATGHTFRELDLLAALDYVFGNI
jgi:hypothetical protein